MRIPWLMPNRAGVPVLMYHRIWPGLSDGLTLTPEALRVQWTYLRDAGYRCLRMEDFLNAAKGKAQVPAKSFLLTFDDGYRNNLTHVWPLLQEFGWQACIFLIAGTLDGSYERGAEGVDQKLSPEELQGMAGDHFCFGLHGYHHENFGKTDLPALFEAMQKSMQVLEEQKLPFLKILAYPYGARPKGAAMKELKSWMESQGIEAAFRIGNRPQPLPAADMFQLQRIDIRGEDTLADFKLKLRKGKLKPF